MAMIAFAFAIDTTLLPSVFEIGTAEYCQQFWRDLAMENVQGKLC